jgi:DNA-binding winged helix-turn-helix (wHTH) protein
MLPGRRKPSLFIRYLCFLQQLMKYLLADAIVYNDEDGSVSLINAPDEDAQLLTCTANTIMKLLVQHHGNVVERETFLHDVWDRRGLQGLTIR